MQRGFLLKLTYIKFGRSKQVSQVSFDLSLPLRVSWNRENPVSGETVGKHNEELCIKVFVCGLHSVWSMRHLVHSCTGTNTFIDSCCEGHIGWLFWVIFYMPRHSISMYCPACAIYERQIHCLSVCVVAHLTDVPTQYYSRHPYNIFVLFILYLHYADLTSVVYRG